MRLDEITAVSHALVLPAQRFDARNAVDTTSFERRAVEKGLQVERSLGRDPHKHPRNNKGFDITSLPKEGPAITIEVKGRLKGSQAFVITRSEVMTSKNKQPHYRLALVEVDPEDSSADRLVCVLNPFNGISFGGYRAGSRVLSWREVWVKEQGPW